MSSRKILVFTIVYNSGLGDSATDFRPIVKINAPKSIGRAFEKIGSKGSFTHFL